MGAVKRHWVTQTKLEIFAVVGAGDWLCLLIGQHRLLQTAEPSLQPWVFYFGPTCCQVRASKLSLIFFYKGIRILLLPKKHICFSDGAPSSHKKTTILISTLKKMTSNMLLSGGVKDFLKSPEMFAKKPLGLIFVNNQKFCPVSPHFFSEQILFWSSLLYQKLVHKHY